MDDDQYWDINDVAKLLHRSVNGIRQMRAMGILPPATKIGNQLYWRKAVWIEWIKEADEPPPEDE